MDVIRYSCITIKRGESKVKKKHILILSLLLSATFLLKNEVYAEVAGSEDTESIIHFIPGASMGSVTDPTAPGVEVIPEIDGESTQGPLRIDYISPIDFGNQLISGMTKTYYPQTIKLTQKDSGEVKYVPQFLQVTDNRGENSGWNLTVSRTEFSNEKNSLTGAQLVVNELDVTTAVTPLLGDEFKPRSLNSLEIPLTKTGAVDFLTADKNQGMSTWIQSFGRIHSETHATTNNGISLTIPASSQKIPNTQYESVITWTLSDGPV